MQEAEDDDDDEGQGRTARGMAGKKKQAGHGVCILCDMAGGCYAYGCMSVYVCV